MKNQLILILITFLFFQSVQIAPTFAQNADSERDATQIKTELAKRGTGEKSKVKIRMRDGRTVKGYIAELNADDFAVADSKTNARTTIPYANVAQVKKQGFSLGAKIGIAAIIVGAVVVTVVAVGVKNLDDDIFPN